MRRSEKGRHFTTWTWEKDGVTKEIEIRVRGEGNNIEFFAIVDSPRVSISSKIASDIPRLLKEHLDKSSTTKWDLKLWVVISSTFPEHNVGGRAISLSFNPVAVGVNGAGEDIYTDVDMHIYTPDHLEKDSEKRQRVWDGKWTPRTDYGIKMGKPVEPEAMRYYSGESHFDGGQPHFILIDGTLENVKAILAAECAFKEMARRIRDLFASPQKAASTLRLIVPLGGMDHPLPLMPKFLLEEDLK